MGSILHPLVAVIAALVQVGPTFVGPQAPSVNEPASAVPLLEPLPARLELIDMPDEFVSSIIWAVSLFEQSELTLPPLRFVHHGDDRSHCGGYYGVHEAATQQSVIGICTTEPGTFTDALILHELSHAWLEHNLSDARQEEFQALRGYEHWRNHAAAEWHENGCEQAAEIMVWGLIDRPVAVAKINDHGCDALDAGYRTLTGAAPLHGYRDHC